MELTQWSTVRLASVALGRQEVGAVVRADPWTYGGLMSLIDSKTKADEGSVVPVVNIEPFLTGDAVDRRQVVSQIGSACEEIGFFPGFWTRGRSGTD